MGQEEYDNMRVKFPIEPCCTSAVHIDSPAKCFDCTNKQIAKPAKNDIMPADRFYNCRK